MIKRLAIIGASAAILAANALPAFAHQGHTSCQGFGRDDVAVFVQSIEKPGQFISTVVPVNDDVAAGHAISCTSE